MKLNLEKLSRSRSFALNYGKEAYLVEPIASGFWSGIQRLYPDDSYKQQYVHIAGELEDGELIPDRIITYGTFVFPEVERYFRFVQLTDKEMSLFGCMMYTDDARVSGVVVNQAGEIVYLCKDDLLTPEGDADPNQDAMVDVMLGYHPENQGTSTTSTYFLDALAAKYPDVHAVISAE